MILCPHNRLNWNSCKPGFWPCSGKLLESEYSVFFLKSLPFQISRWFETRTKMKKKKEDSVFPPGCHLIPPIQVTGYRCQRIKHLMLETWWLSSFQGESSPLASKSPKSALLGENRSEGQSWNCDLKPPRSSKADLPGWSCFYSRECHGRGMCTWQTVGVYFILCFI